MGIKSASKQLTNRWAWSRQARIVVGQSTKYVVDFGVLRGIRMAIKDRPGNFDVIELDWPGYRAPFRLRTGASDIATFRHVIAQNGYQLPFELTSRPKVVVDAGANSGLASVWYACRYPDAKIIAIEPEAENFDLLVRNTRQYPNIVPLRGALWSQRGSLKLTDPGEGPWAYRVDVANEHDSEVASVDAYDVPSLLDEFGLERLDIFKIDIEGSEKEVFESAAGWIDKVDVIAIELHDRFKPGCSAAFDAATSDFAKRDERGEDTFVSR